MVWSDAKDYVMLKEVAGLGVFDSKPGSRERGTAWQNVANKLNSLPNFTVNSRAVRDRFNTISRKLKAKLTREANESGGGDMEEPTELEALLEELLELSEESEKKAQEKTEAKKETVEKERQQAIEMRERAMESMGATRKRCQEKEGEPAKAEKRRRRSGGDTLEWLRERAVAETEMKEKELEEKKKRREELEATRQQQGEQVAMAQQQMLQLMQQQQQQQQKQQQQQQQQFAMMQQQMLAVIQQQQQQVQALFNLLQKKE